MENSQFKDKHSYHYDLETKQFAMTLYYYSPKTYEIVHNVFFLPHSSTIRSWTTSVDCEPGFFCYIIRLIGKVVKTKPYMSDVVLIVDAIELHKGSWWDQKKRGYIGRVAETCHTEVPKSQIQDIWEKHSEMVILRNIPSLQHELTRTILFRTKYVYI